MSELFQIIEDITILEKFILKQEIEKSRKKYPIGTIITRKDGNKYRKISETGSSNKDWKLVTENKDKDKEDKEERIKNDKQDTSTLDKEDLSNQAKNSSEIALQNAIKQSSNPEIRQAALNELERRKNEETPKKENNNDVQGKEKLNKINFVEKFRTLSDDQIKFYLNAPYENVKEAAKIIADERGLNVISKEDYIGQFENYDLSDDYDSIFEEYLLDKDNEEVKEKLEEIKIKNLDNFKFASFFYKDEASKISSYLSDKSEIKWALEYYVGNGFIEIRDFLTNEEEFIDSYGNIGEETKNKIKERVNRKVDSISKFISDNKLKKDLVLYRMVEDRRKNPFFTKLNEGDIYEDKSFSSTSLIKQKHFGDFTIKILAKKGSNVANVDNPGELEYLVDRGSKFRVIEKRKDGLGITVELL